MKRYEFSFRTKIKFASEVIEQNFMIRFMPGNYQFQKIYDERLRIYPEESILTFDKDSFGNRTVSGCIKEKHEYFEYEVCGKAFLSKYKVLEPLDRVYLYETVNTSLNEVMKKFTESITKSDDIEEQVKLVSHAVHSRMKYKPNSTNTKTTAKEAFEQGTGVCQDFSHITIAILRKLGIAARYCIGLIVGEGETHAWVEYYDNGAWYGVDPTNDRLIKYGYIKISNGRDYNDCSVDRGCFVSTNKTVNQEIEVLVKVGEIND